MAYKGYSGYGSSQGDTPEDQIAALQLMAQSQGVTLEEQKPKSSVLEKIGRILNVGRAATAGIQSGVGIIEGIKQNLDTEKIWKKKLGRELTTAEKAAAFAEDVALDPTTYLTLGLGTGAKVGGKVLTKAGTAVIKNAGEAAAKGIAEKGAAALAKREAIEAAKATIATGIKAGDEQYLKYIDKGGIKVLGKTVVSGDKLTAPLKKAGALVENVAPGVAQAGKTVQKSLGKAFGGQSYEVKQLVKTLRDSGDEAKVALADRLEQSYLRANRNLVRSNNAAGDAAVDFLAPEAKITDAAQRSRITSALEDPASLSRVDDPVVRDATEKIRTMYQSQFAELEKRGILDEGIEDYAARNLTKEAREKIKDAEGLGFARGNLSTSIGSAGEHRTNQATIAESEQILKDKYGIKGDVYNKDALVNAANYQAKTQAAINNFDAHQSIMKEIGVDAPVEERIIHLKDGEQKIKKDFGKFTDAAGVTYVVPNIKWYKESGKAVPEVIAKDLERTQQALTNEASLKEFLGVATKIQNVWKSSVTGIFPSFHVRNVFGGGYNNWLAGVSDVKPYKEAAEVLNGVKAVETTLDPAKVLAGKEKLRGIKLTNKLGEEISGEEVMKAYDQTVGRGSGRAAEMGNVTTAYANDTKSNVLRGLNKATRGVTENVEEHLRLPLFIDTWKKTGSFDEAAEKVFKFHFDYSSSGASNFENAVMKKVMPFYTWSRNNIPLQIEQALKQPGKQGATIKLFNALVDPDVRENLPSYLQGGLAVQTGKEKNGMAPVLTGLGLPLEDLNNLSVRGITGMLSPLIKTPVEFATGKSTFYDKDIDDLGPQFAKYYQSYPEPIREWLELKKIEKLDPATGKMKVTYTGNPRKLYALQSAGGRITSSLFKVGDDAQGAGQKTLNSLTGINVRSVDLEQEKYYRSRELLEAYQKKLQEQGVVKPYTTYYQPKGTKVSDA